MPKELLTSATFGEWLDSKRGHGDEIINALRSVGLGNIREALSCEGDKLCRFMELCNAGVALSAIVAQLGGDPEEETQEPTINEPKKRGRQYGSKNKKVNPYAWKANVVRHLPEVIPAVQDVLWRKGNIRAVDILKYLTIEGDAITEKAVYKTIHEECAKDEGRLVKKFGGFYGSGKNLKRNEYITCRAERPNGSYYYLGQLRPTSVLARGAVVSRIGVKDRLEAGWDVREALTVTTPKGPKREE